MTKTGGIDRRLLAAGLVVMALSWLAAVGWILPQIGPVGVLAGIPAAALVAAGVLATLRWVGRSQPRTWLLAAFAWGATIAAPASIPIQAGVNWIIGPGAYGPLAVTPLSEEGVKGLFVVGLLVFFRRRITGLLDGIVYAGVAAAGFAFTENILYLGGSIARYLDGSAPTSTLLVELALRVLLVPFMHPLWTSLIGVGVAVALTRRHPTAWVVLGFLGASLFHGIWDATALGAAASTLFLPLYAFVMVPLFVVMIVVVLRARHRTKLADERQRLDSRR